ncbi:MAG: carbohydrate ABC transporter permease [Clostridia bacterium]|nr:carbohydrate ABC transporter permease [Clostridia bacterium]
MNKSLKRSDRALVQGVVVTWITLCTVFCLIPLFITIVNALKDNDAVTRNIFSMPNILDIRKDFSHNFSFAWDKINDAFFRSILLTLIGALIDIALGALLGYIFTYKEFPFKEIIFMIFISVMLLPSIMGMPILVPFIRNKLNLYDTYFGYLLPNIAGGQVGGLFLFRTFFGQQPKSIYESAQIEGANDWDIFFRLTTPLAFPIILYKFVGTFSSLYNDLLWPILILDENLTLMPTMISQASKFVDGTYGQAENGALYAMYIISGIPLIFTSIISMKFFSSGDFAAGIKL